MAARPTLLVVYAFIAGLFLFSKMLQDNNKLVCLAAPFDISSHDVVADGSETMLGPPRVYVYPPPHGQSPEDLLKCVQKRFPNFDIMKDTGRKVHGIKGYVQEDMAEWFLHKQMEGSSLMTTNISEADYFIVNVMPRVSNIASKCNGVTHIERQRAWREVLEDSKQFKIYPRRHAFICQTWFCGALLVEGMPKHVAKMTYLIHERLKNWALLPKDFKQSFNDSQMLMVPYVAHSDITPFTELPLLKKTKKVTFLGTINRSKLNGKNWRSPIASMKRINMLDNGVKLGKSAVSVDYAQEMLHSTFCLVPSGDTASSRRLFDAMLAGCIPVFVGVRYDRPFEDIIPYDSFSIHLDNDKYLSGEHQQEVDKLWNITEGEIDSRLNEMAKYIRYVDWRNGNSTFEAILRGMMAENEST